MVNNEDWNSGAYSYDGSGNIRAIGGQRYRYDGVSRLVEAELRIPETSETLFGVESFTYDAYGNLTSRETTEGGSSTTVNTPADSTTNRLTGATSYDSEGNLTSWNGAQYGFDALGRMVRMQNGAEDWLFVYTSGGERVLQLDQAGTGNRRWTIRDAVGRVLREWFEPQGGSPTWDRDWIYRGANLLATIDATTTRHLTLDHLGTPRLVTDQTGAKLAFKSYWPYGREATDPNQDGLSKKFTGHERDAYDPSSTADDLDYMHARFANPATGRFLSVDPLLGTASSPQSLNRFAYVGGNPINYLDPRGLEATSYCPEGSLCFDDWTNVIGTPWCGSWFNSLWNACSNEYPLRPNRPIGPLGPRFPGGGPGGGEPPPPEPPGGPAPPAPPGGGPELPPGLNEKDLKFILCVGQRGNWGLGTRDSSREAAGYRIRHPDGTTSTYVKKGSFDEVEGVVGEDGSYPRGTDIGVHTHPGELNAPGPSLGDRRGTNRSRGATTYIISPPGGLVRYKAGDPASGVQIAPPGWERRYKHLMEDACDGVQTIQ